MHVYISACSIFAAESIGKIEPQETSKHEKLKAEKKSPYVQENLTLKYPCVCTQHSNTPGNITILLLSQKRKSVKTLATEVRIALDCIKTLTYNCGDEHYQILQQVKDELTVITATLQKQLPKSEGLVVRPQLKLRDLARQRNNVAVKLGIS